MRRRFRRMFGLEPKADVDDELAFHVEMRVRELVARGETPDRAREITLRRFGSYEGPRQACIAINERRRRALTRRDYLMELRQDVLYALRMLWRAPAFTLAAVVTLALGIGANSAIFSVVHGVLLQALPFRDADRLYHVNMLYPDGTEYPQSSAPDFMSVRAATRGFEQVEAFSREPATLTGSGEAREIDSMRVSDGFFPLMGWQALIGRTLTRDENQPGRHHVAVLDHGFWTRDFGADRNVLGRTLVLGGTPHTIVGVLDPSAHVTEPVDVYVPLEYGETFSATTARGRRGEFLDVIGRAGPGVTAAQVSDDVSRIGAELQRTFPDTNARLTFTATPLRDVIVGDARKPLLVLLGAVAFVLLVACANVANLLLARSSARQGELSVRAALGASRPRLIRQLLTESVVLSTIGGIIGLALAVAGTRALVAAQPADIPRLDEVGVSAPVILFTFAVILVTSVVIALLPALQATSTDLTRRLSAGGRDGGSGHGGQRLRAGLIVAEMALAVVLLTGAGLLIRSFAGLTAVHPGFEPERALSFRVSLQGEAYAKAPAARTRVAEIEEAIRGLPGVANVGASSLLPLSGRGGLVDFRVEGAPPPPADVNQEIGIASVTPSYFAALGAPLIRGRFLTPGDTSETPRVALFNEAAARFWMPDQDPIGRRVNMSGTSYEIVGIVGNVLQRNPADPALPQIYVPHGQRTNRTMRFVVRAAGDGSALGQAIRGAIQRLDANLPIEAVEPLDVLVSKSVARPRFYTSLITLFAAVALALAATGIFGVVSYTVAQRTREISIRLALGAGRRSIVGLIVGRGALLVAIGLAAGLAAAIALGKAIEAQLFGVTRFDPWTLTVVGAVLAASALLASLLPVLRASRLDPAQALREG